MELIVFHYFCEGSRLWQCARKSFIQDFWYNILYVLDWLNICICKRIRKPMLIELRVNADLSFFCYLTLVSLPSNKKNNIKLIRIPHLILRGLLSWLIFLSNKPYASDLKENYDCYSRNAHSVSCYYHLKDVRNWHSNLALPFVKLVFYENENIG